MKRKGSRTHRRIKNLIFKHPIDLCFWCKKPLKYKIATLDHVKELCIGGDYRRENLVIACRKCNSERSAAVSTYINIIIKIRLPKYKLILKFINVKMSMLNE